MKREQLLSHDKRLIKALERELLLMEMQIQTIQANARELVSKARNEAGLLARNKYKRLWAHRVEEKDEENLRLAKAIARMGKEVACPDCGCVHLFADLLRADSE